jgi:hypothetical protein
MLIGGTSPAASEVVAVGELVVGDLAASRQNPSA